MGEDDNKNESGSMISMPKKKGVQMNSEELRINKQLLKEISRKKKEKINAQGSEVASVIESA